MCPTCPLASLVFMLTGAFLSGCVGLIVHYLSKRREAVWTFRSSLAEFAVRTKVGDFHHESCKGITAALFRLRPYISDSRFSACIKILTEYKAIPEKQMDRQTSESAAYTVEHKITPDARFFSYVERFDRAVS